MNVYVELVMATSTETLECDVSVVIFRHESLTSEQVLERLIEHYKAWAAHRPGSRL